MVKRRKTSKGKVLRENESERKDGVFQYRWRDRTGKRHYIYGKTLEELRAKEEKVKRDKSDGIKVEAMSITVNDVFDLWLQLKKGVKRNTLTNYVYMYDVFAREEIGKYKITTLKKSDIRRYYNKND